MGPGEPITEAAWSAHRAALHRFVVTRVRDHMAAEDIVHDVLVKAHARPEPLRKPETLKAWLYQVTRNAIVDYYRARKPAEALPDELRGEPQDTDHAERELAGCLTPLLAGLPAAYADPLRLADLEGVAQQEVASRLGLSLSAAKSRIQRARRMLRDVLLRCCRVEMDRRGSIAAYEAIGSCGNGQPAESDAAGACECRSAQDRPRR
jgi:RNA polymerase sigma-70 factor (ECF subfamily)